MRLGHKHTVTVEKKVRARDDLAESLHMREGVGRYDHRCGTISLADGTRGFHVKKRLQCRNAALPCQLGDVRGLNPENLDAGAFEPTEERSIIAANVDDEI